MRRGWRAYAMPPLLAAGVAAVVLLGRMAPARKWVIYSEAEAAAVKNVHDYKGQPLCQRCHPQRDRRLAADPVTLCGPPCHSFDHGNHPVGVEQRAPAQVAVPLGAGHRVVCHSCHDPHDVERLPGGLRLPFNELCMTCHPGY